MRPKANRSFRKTLLVSSASAAMTIAIAVLLTGCKKESEQPTVSIRQATWKVELAATDMQRYQGLSGRDNLPEGTGMLFLFSAPCILDFCMRDCLIPLDIAFIDSDLLVVATHTMAVEPDGKGSVVYSSSVPAQFALEVPAGSLGCAGVQLGDKALLSPTILNAAKDADSQ